MVGLLCHAAGAGVLVSSLSSSSIPSCQRSVLHASKRRKGEAMCERKSLVCKLRNAERKMVFGWLQRKEQDRYIEDLKGEVQKLEESTAEQAPEAEQNG